MFKCAIRKAITSTEQRKDSHFIPEHLPTKQNRTFTWWANKSKTNNIHENDTNDDDHNEHLRMQVKSTSLSDKIREAILMCNQKLT